MCPLKVDITDLNYFFFSPKYNCDLTEKEKTLDRTLFSLNCDSALDVILEDKPMVESCQSGLEEECSQSGILSLTEEIRIIEFHNNLKKEYDRHA